MGMSAGTADKAYGALLNVTWQISWDYVSLNLHRAHTQVLFELRVL